MMVRYKTPFLVVVHRHRTITVLQSRLIIIIDGGQRSSSVLVVLNTTISSIGATSAFCFFQRCDESRYPADENHDNGTSKENHSKFCNAPTTTQTYIQQKTQPQSGPISKRGRTMLWGGVYLRSTDQQQQMRAIPSDRRPLWLLLNDAVTVK